MDQLEMRSRVEGVCGGGDNEVFYRPPDSDGRADVAHLLQKCFSPPFSFLFCIRRTSVAQEEYSHRLICAQRERRHLVVCLSLSR